jgi:SAM-dependent methyltransferase
VSTAPVSNRRARTAEDWLDAYVEAYYYAPSLALWRALEAQALGEEPVATPSLDIGGFDGSFVAAWLGDRPPLDVGVDLSPVASPWMSRAYRLMVKGDALRLPFADDTFAFVLCNSVIEHLPDDRAALKEMGRVLKRGGRLVVATPSIYFHENLDTVRRARQRGDEAAAARYIAMIDERLVHRRYRPVEEWTTMLEAAGLRLEAHSYCVPPEAGAAWDRWTRMDVRKIGGREQYRYIASRKLSRVLPRSFWKRIFIPLLRADYERGVRDQAVPGALGIDLVLKAVRV